MPYFCPVCNDQAVGIKVTIQKKDKEITIGYLNMRTLTYSRFWVNEARHLYLKENSYGIEKDIVEGLLKKKKCRWFKIHSADRDGMLRCRVTAMEFLANGILVEQEDDAEKTVQLHVPLQKFKIVAEKKGKGDEYSYDGDSASQGTEIICIKCGGISAYTVTGLIEEEFKVCNHCKTPRTCMTWCQRCNKRKAVWDGI